jgi:hypothetical protein
MKSEIRMALLVLASASAPAAFAQDTPQCATFFDNAQQFFTAAGAPDGALNRQCFLTVMPKDGPSSVANFPNLAQYPQPQLMEGTYEIILSGGGGGGGGGGLLASGGGGAGAVPYKTQTYLKPGVYKLTLGTGGRGGAGGFTVGGNGEDGAPTSMTMAYTNETVAGFRGADTWARAPQQTGYMVASSRNVPPPGPDGIIADGQGAQGVNGMGSGGSGGILPVRDEYGHRRAERPAQDGAPMPVADIPTGQPGRGGPRDGGGGGGAGFGNGGDGKSIVTASNDYQTGTRGGDGFVKLTPIQLAAATPAAAPVQAQPEPYVAPRSAKRDRN